MNLAGRSYLAVKNFLKPPFNPRPDERQMLTSQFLHEWEEQREINPATILARALRHAVTTVPYYRNWFAQNPDKNSSNLRDWPILTRDLLRDQFSQLQSENPLTKNSWTHASGGSTGKPVTVIHDEYFAAKAQALRELCAKLFYGGPYYNKLVLWGMSGDIERQINSNQAFTKQLKNFLLQLGGIKTSHINTFNFTREKFEECAHILTYQKPEFIMGYAGSVYQLAKYLEEQQITPKGRIYKIATTAQTLYPFMRDKIEQVFNCEVCDHYGSREVGPIAWQHSNGEMYFPKFFSTVEVVDNHGNGCVEGEEGKILITSMHNFSMPLIRYEIGDMGVSGPDRVHAGYPFSALTHILGKSNEEFIRKDGTLIHGQFFINLFYNRPWVDEFHVVQKEHERIQILYVPTNQHTRPPPTDVEEINERIKNVMGHRCEMLWQKVDEIPVTGAGKRLYVRSEVR